MSDKYRVAQICPNGHVITPWSDGRPQHAETYCSRCGEETLTACPTCKEPIRGEFHVVGYVSLEPSRYRAPGYCHNCGKPFPWTLGSLAAVLELLKMGLGLEVDKARQVEADLTTLVKATPQTHVAALRLRRLLEGVSAPVAEGVRKILGNALANAVYKQVFE